MINKCSLIISVVDVIGLSAGAAFIVRKETSFWFGFFINLAIRLRSGAFARSQSDKLANHIRETT